MQCASQGQIDKCECCHTEMTVADQTWYLTQSECTDIGPSSPSSDLWCQESGGVATRVPIYMSLACLEQRKLGLILTSPAQEVDMLPPDHHGSHPLHQRQSQTHSPHRACLRGSQPPTRWCRNSTRRTWSQTSSNRCTPGRTTSRATAPALEPAQPLVCVHYLFYPSFVCSKHSLSALFTCSTLFFSF